MENDVKVPITRADRAFLKLGMAAMAFPVIAFGAYAILVMSFDRHPAAPFIEPDRVMALEVFSSICGIPGPSFTLLPAAFELQETKIHWACEMKLKRSSGS